MIYLNLTKEEEKILKPQIDDFNRLCLEGNYPEILSWNHYDLHKNSILENSTPQLWKIFLVHPKIKQWYSEEQDLQLRITFSKILQDITDGKSTGQAQTISAILNQLNKTDKQESQNFFIYQFVPLTEFEKENPNVKILENVPNEIRDAIQVIGQPNNSKKE
jgi:hypothetical protein